MLEFLRKQKRSILGVILAVVMVVFMIGFGVDYYNNVARNEQQPAIKLNDTEIGMARVGRELEQLTRMYRSQFGANFETFRAMMNLEQQVVDNIINTELLSTFTAKLGFSTSTKEIEEKILTSPFFAQGFSQESYRQYLRALGVSGTQLEELTRGELVQEQLVSVLNDFAVPSTAELRAVYENRERKFQFYYTEFAPSDFTSRVSVDEQALGEFFEKNKEQYRAPKKARFTSMAFPAKAFEAKVPVIEEDVQELYEARQHEFVEPRQFLLRQIVIKRGEKSEGAEANQSSLNSDEAKRKIAEGIVERLKAGESFSKLVGELSEESSAKEKGGELGWRLSAQLPEALRSVVQDLDKGQFSGVVESSDGFLIVQLDDTREPRQKPLEEVRAVIEGELRQTDAPLYAETAAAKALEQWQSSGVPLQEFGAKNDLTVFTVEKFVQEGESAGSAPVALTSEVLKLSSGAREKVDVSEVPYLVEVTEVQESVIPPLTEVRARVVGDYTKEQAVQLAKTAATARLTEVKGGNVKGENAAANQPLPSLLGAGAKETKPQTRSDQATGQATEQARAGDAAEGLLSNPAVNGVVFALTPSSPLPAEPIAADGKFYLFQLREIQPAPATGFDEKKLLASEEQAAGGRLYRSLIQSLRSSAEIWVNPEVLQKQG